MSGAESGEYIQVEDALRVCEERLRGLLTSVKDGFYLADILFDDNGEPCDYRFVEVNPAFERMIGLKREQIIGGRALELFPVPSSSWMSIFRTVALTGTAVDYSFYSPVFKKHFEIHASRPTACQFAALVKDVTEQKHAEEVRCESESRLRGIFEQGKVGVAVTDLDGRFVQTNQVFQRMTGFSEDELLSLKISDITHPDDMDFETSGLEDAVSSGCLSSEMEKRYVTKGGESIWIRLNASVMADAECKPAFAVWIVEDITRQKASQDLLAKYQLLSDNSRDIILFVNQDGQILEANDAAVSAYGYTHEELLCLTIFDLRAPDCQEQIRAQMAEGDRNGILFETRHRRKDGTELPVEVSSRGACLAGRRVLLSIIRDITERKRAEESLRQALEEAEEGRALLMSLMDNVPDGITIADAPDVMVRMVSRFGQELLGGSHDSMTAMQVAHRWQVLESDGVTPMPDEDLPLVRAIKRGEIIRNMEMLQMNELGMILTLLCNAAPICDSEGTITGGIVAWRDITLRKRAEKALAEAKDLLEHQVFLLQRALIPAKPSVIDGYSVASAYIPAFAGQEIGGDFLDIFRTEDGKVGVLIGDVSGKGIESAAMAAATRSTIRAFAYDLSSPSEALSHANSLLFAYQSDDMQFVTAFLAILDPLTGDVSYCSAGHPPAVVCCGNGDTDLLYTHNLPLGVMGFVMYEESQHTLKPGDRLILYTDGITEARQNSELFGTERLEMVLSKCISTSTEELVAEILKAVKDWSHDKLRDDTAVVVIEREM